MRDFSIDHFTVVCFVAWPLNESEARVDFGFLVSKETVLLRRWGRSKQKFGFIKRVDKC